MRAIRGIRGGLWVSLVVLNVGALEFLQSPCLAQFSASKLVEGQRANSADLTRLTGDWRGKASTKKGYLHVHLLLSDNEKYRGIMTLSKDEAGAERLNTLESAGAWKLTRTSLFLVDAVDRAEVKSEYRFDNGALVLIGFLPDGGDLRLTATRAKKALPKTASQSSTNSGAAGSIPKGVSNPVERNPIAGEWFASGDIPSGGKMHFKVTFTATGNYEIRVALMTNSGTSESSASGKWEQKGQKLELTDQERKRVVPFAMAGKDMLLDYSQNGGMVLELSRTRRRGNVHFVEAGSSASAADHHGEITSEIRGGR